MVIGNMKLTDYVLILLLRISMASFLTKISKEAITVGSRDA
jgi:hypothetical protein